MSSSPQWHQQTTEQILEILSSGLFNQKDILITTLSKLPSPSELSNSSHSLLIPHLFLFSQLSLSRVFDAVVRPSHC